MVCSLCGGRVKEVDATHCPNCGRYFTRAEGAVEDPSKGWTSKLGVKRVARCEVCGERDPEQLGVRLARFTLDMSGQYWETVHAICRDCGTSLRFGETVAVADIRAVKLDGKWEEGDDIVRKAEGVRRCVACHELDQRRIGVYETMFFLKSGAYGHPEAWRSEIVICKECYDDLRTEIPRLFAKARKVKLGRSRTPCLSEEAPRSPSKRVERGPHSGRASCQNWRR